MKQPYLFFDAGGTVVFLSYETFRREAARLHYSFTPEEFDRARGILGHRHDLLRLRGLSQEEIFGGRHFFRLVLEELGIPPEDAETIKDGIAAANKMRNIWSEPRPWMRDTLAGLRASGYGMSIISNTDGRVREQLEDGGVASYFDSIFDSRLIGLSKPDPRFFLFCCDRLRLQPRDCLYVGDSLAVDVRGANLAGMPAVLVDQAGLYGDWDCLRIRTVQELPALLQEHQEISEAPGAFVFRGEGTC